MKREEMERRMRGRIGEIPKRAIPYDDAEWMIDQAVTVALAAAEEARAEENERAAQVADLWRDSVTCTPGDACEHIRLGAKIGERIRARMKREEVV